MGGVTIGLIGRVLNSFCMGKEELGQKSVTLVSGLLVCFSFSRLSICMHTLNCLHSVGCVDTISIIRVREIYLHLWWNKTKYPDHFKSVGKDANKP